MKIKHSFLLFIFFSYATAYSQKNPYDTLDYDKMIMYEFNISDHESSIIYNEKESPSITKSVELTPEISKEINKRLGKKSSFGEVKAACFEPHLGFVYYKNNQIVAHITICMDCNVLDSSLELPAQQQGKGRFEGRVFYTLNGMSDGLRKFLNDLLIKNSFSYLME